MGYSTLTKFGFFVNSHFVSYLYTFVCRIIEAFAIIILEK